MVATSESQFFRVSMILLQEELFTGANKKFHVSRRLRDGSTGGYVQVTKTIECPIKPGYKAGTKMTFPDDGDEQPDGENSSLQPCSCACLLLMAPDDSGLRSVIESNNVILEP